MKRMIFCLLVFTLVASAYCTIYQGWSSTSYTMWRNTGDPDWHSTASTTQTSIYNPAPWQKSEGQWVTPNKPPEATIYFGHYFTLPGSSPSYHVSSADLWISFDDSSPSDAVEVRIIHDPEGSHEVFIMEIMKGDTLYRIDFADWLDNFSGSATYEIRLTSGGDNTHKVNFYYCVNYAYAASRTLSFSEGGYYLVSLPKRYIGGTTLSALFPTIIGAWVWNPFAGAWNAISYTSPLTGSLGFLVRTKSIMIFLLGACSSSRQGYSLERQRYLDVRCPSWAEEHYPIGSVACPIAFNWNTGQPNDLYNLVVGEAYLYDHATGNYVPDAPPTGDYIIQPFEGHLTEFDVTRTAQVDNNGHLDMICYYELVNTSILPPPTESSGESGPIYAHEDENPIIGNVPPLGYDENGLPFPPEVPGYPFEKAIAPVPSEKVFMTTFPNPFNSFIDIIIYAPKEMDGETVQLIIYDTRGNIVYKTNGKSEKGTALFRWNGSNKNGMHASSGIYFYKVSIWNYSVTGNICYVR